jgi:hypothetical protein
MWSAFLFKPITLNRKEEHDDIHYKSRHHFRGASASGGMPRRLWERAAIATTVPNTIGRSPALGNP